MFVRLEPNPVVKGSYIISSLNLSSISHTNVPGANRMLSKMEAHEAAVCWLMMIFEAGTADESWYGHCCLFLLLDTKAKS